MALIEHAVFGVAELCGKLPKAYGRVVRCGDEVAATFVPLEDIDRARVEGESNM